MQHFFVERWVTMQESARVTVRQRVWILALGIIVTTVFGVFRSVRDAEILVYDDLEHIVYNPQLMHNADGINWHGLWTKPYFDLYVPLSYSAWALVVDRTLTQNETFNDPLILAQNKNLATNLHSLSLALHELNSVLIFFLLTMLGTSWSGGVIGSLLFALHPLQVESVAWISECRGLLATAFALMALILWLSSIQRLKSVKSGMNETQAKQKNFFYAVEILAWTLFSLSLLAKPSTVVVPVLATIFGVAFFEISLSHAALRILPWFLSSIMATGITALLQKDLVSLWPWWERILVAGDAFNFYLKKIALPVTLMPDYSRRPDLTDLSLAIPAGLIWVAFGYVLFSFRNYKVVLVTMTVFLVALISQLGFFPSLYQSVSTVADRYVYLAMLGPAYGIGKLWDLDGISFKSSKIHVRAWWSLVMKTAIIAGLCGLTYKTTLQLGLWQSTTSLFAYNAHENHMSYTAPHALGDLAMMRHDGAKAAMFYRRAIHARPEFAQGYASLGRVLLEQGKAEEAKAELLKAVEINAGDPSSRLNLGVSLQRTGFMDQAVQEYHAVNALSPHPLAYFNLGAIYMQKEAWTEAESAFLEALKLNPRLAEAQVKLTRVHEILKEKSEHDTQLRILENNRSQQGFNHRP